jgi:hypothetical protein
MDFNEALKCAKAKLWPQLRFQAKLGNEKIYLVGGAHPDMSRSSFNNFWLLLKADR